MIFNVITNLHNGAGLEQDYYILRHILGEWGHEVNGIQFNDRKSIESARSADCNIFCEVITPDLLSMSPCNVFIPNPEWYFPDRWNQHLDEFSAIWCKTEDTRSIFSPMQPRADCRFVGWYSRDFYDPGIQRQRSFIHVPGKSRTKNTAEILDAWRSSKECQRHKLTVVSQRFSAHGIPNVRHLRHLEEFELRTLMNRNTFHLCCSKYEGWGHSLHEAMSVGASVITTDIEPMRSFGTPVELLVPPIGVAKQGVASVGLIGAEGIINAVRAAADLGDQAIESISKIARKLFSEQRAAFHAQLREAVSAL